MEEIIAADEDYAEILTSREDCTVSAIEYTIRSFMLQKQKDLPHAKLKTDIYNDNNL